jgi:transposase
MPRIHGGYLVEGDSGMAIDWTQIKTFRAGTTNLIAAMCEELGFEQIVNRMVTWDPKQCLLSPGTLAKAVVINILDDRHALWRMEEYFAQRDTEALFGAGVTPAHLNDDALGRMLDRVAAAGAKELFMQVVLAAIQKHELDLRHIHSDTTSWSLTGKYEGRGGLNITFGHSKDNRPDLKQILYGLAVTRDGVPVLGQVMGGNTSDKVWNEQVIPEVKKLLTPQQLAEVIYVADSALVTKSNLRLLVEQKLRFISRLPANFGLLDELKEEAWKLNSWTPIGALSEKKGAAEYKVQEFQRELDGRSYRFIVVHSSQLDARKQKTLQREIEQEETELKAAAERLQKQEFDCRADAERAAADFVTAHADRLHPVEVEVQEVRRIKRRPGRPRKDEEPSVEICYRIEARVLPPLPAHLAERHARASVFVLITNLDAATHSAADVLREYKEQTAVELRFRFLKDPFVVDQLYLKNKERVEALAYLLLIAVLIGSLLERRVRMALARLKEELTVPGGVRRSRPTVQGLLDMFSVLNVLAAPAPNGLERHVPHVAPETRRALELAGFSERIYTRPHPPVSA